MLLSICWVVCSYLLGSVPVGLLLARLRGSDPRSVGSGNIGATNVMRAAGKTIGMITLAGDAFKGFLPVCLAIRFDLPAPVVAAAAFAAFAGHLFPIYLGFRGGKGVATALGIFLALSYVAVLIDFVIFALILVKWRYVSLASLVSTALMPVILLFLNASASYVLLSLLMAILIFVKHRANIERLRTGKENRMGRRRD